MLRRKLQDLQKQPRQNETLYAANCSDKDRAQKLTGWSALRQMADNCSAVEKIYAAVDERRRQRPLEYEDYCRMTDCSKVRKRFKRKCDTEPRDDENVDVTDTEQRCETCQDFETCPPLVPCQDRYRKNTLPNDGRWRRGYERHDERYRMLVRGKERNFIHQCALAQWKMEFDQGFPTHGCVGTGTCS